MNKQELLLKLAEMIIASDNASPTNEQPAPHRLTGKHVIIRSRDSGCHFGVLVYVNGRHVVLNKSRRMWRWWAAKEMTLSGVAKFGLNTSKEELRIQSEVDGQEILDACEIIPCSMECVKSFECVEPYNEQ